MDSGLERAIEVKRTSWRNERTEKYLRSVMVTHVLPKIGNKPVDGITPADILSFLTPLAMKTPQVAKRAKIGLSTAFMWAIAQGLIDRNPADRNLAAGLPKLANKEHHRALPYSEVAQALETVRNTNALPGTKLAVEFLVLTAARSGEAREATWSEIDLCRALWTVPARRTKNGREHRVPLSASALAILEQARQLLGDNGLIFPSVRGKSMSDNTLSKLLRENGIESTVHGFRSSFRNWAIECTPAPWAVAEAALSHTVGNSTEAAYMRSDLFEQRKTLMDTWANFLNDCSS